MNSTRFEKSVIVLVGMGLPVRIETVMEAYALLQDWPIACRNGTHAIALSACKAGIAGEIDPETVRSIFVAFARRNDILVPHMDSLTPAISTRSVSSVNARQTVRKPINTGSYNPALEIKTAEEYLHVRPPVDELVRFP
ncbi:DUF982 domain-containing protein, partial [Mesorhizobium sp. CGMCC 1.15528]